MKVEICGNKTYKTWRS